MSTTILARLLKVLLGAVLVLSLGACRQDADGDDDGDNGSDDGSRPAIVRLA